MANTAVEDDRHWTVVDQLQFHLRAKLTSFNANIAKPGAREEVFVEPPRVIGWGRASKRGAALTDIGVQSELRDHQQGSPDRAQRQVHLAGSIGEDPHTYDTVENVFGVRLDIAATNPEQDDEAATDFTKRAFATADRSS